MSDTAAGAEPSLSEREAPAYLYMLTSSLAFATMGALSHLAGDRVSWQVVAAARTFVAFALTLALCLTARVRLALLRPRVLWVRSVAGSVGIIFSFYALTHLPVSTALTLSNTVPFWVTLLAWPVLGQRPTAQVWLAVSVGVVGIALIQRPQMAGDRLAGLLALGNAFSTSVSMLGLNRLGGLDARAVVTHFSGLASALMLCVLLFSGGSVDYAPLAGWATLLLLVGVGVAGAAGQLTMTRAFALGSPSRVSVVGLMQIVFALLYDLLLWRRRFDALTLLGILLVTTPSAWLLLRRPLRREAEIHSTT